MPYPLYFTTILPSMVQGGSPMALVSPPTPPDIDPPSGPTANVPPYTNEIGPNITQVLQAPSTLPGVAPPSGPSGNLAQYTNEIGPSITQVVANNPTTLTANGVARTG